MNDLLSRMIARTNGPVSPLGPVLASRYDSAAYDPAVLSEMPVLSREVEELKQMEAIQAADRPPDETPGPADVEQLESRVPSFVPIHAAATDVHQKNPSRPAERHGFDEIRPTTSQAALRVREEMREARLGTEESPVERRSREVVAQTIQARVTVTKSIAQERDPVHPQRTVAAPNSGTAPEHGAQGVAVLPPTAAPAEVNVTIGAIEVRLAQPAKPVVRKAATPKVSLDDYLRRRNGGPR